MDSFIEEFKQKMSTKREIQGYVLTENKNTDMSLILIKNNDKYWNTVWLSNKEHTYNIPDEPLSNIFKYNN